jgi:hypothetical protein
MAKAEHWRARGPNVPPLLEELPRSLDLHSQTRGYKLNIYNYSVGCKDKLTSSDIITPTNETFA